MSHETAASDDLSGHITSWRDFQDRVRAGMAMAAATPSSLTLMDTDFVHWPIGERAIVDAFQQWAVKGGRAGCQLLAASFDDFARCHPRWTAWRPPWSHKIRCLQAPEELVSSLSPTFVLHGQLGLRVHEPLHGTGIWTRDTRILAAWITDSDVILQRSADALPPTTLGL